MPKILVTDDDPLMIDFLVPSLQHFGFEVEGYYNSQEAFERFKVEPFDVVVSDLYMPELDGRQLTLQIKELRNEVPVIIITAYPSSESILDLGAVGISDYVTKPFDIQKLVTSINTCLGTT